MSFPKMFEKKGQKHLSIQTIKYALIFNEKLRIDEKTEIISQQ